MTRPYEIRVSSRTSKAEVVHAILCWLDDRKPIYFAAIGPRCVTTVMLALAAVYQRTGKVVAVTTRLVRRRLPALNELTDPLWVVSLLIPCEVPEETSAIYERIEEAPSEPGVRTEEG